MQAHQRKSLPSGCYCLFAAPKKALGRHQIAGVATRWLIAADVDCSRQGIEPLASRYDTCKCVICGEEYLEKLCDGIVMKLEAVLLVLIIQTLYPYC